ncbi:MAG: DNA-processing protein DprA [Anaerolineae bacterium]|nr:DNA-processing protein DprA [Anaerolineae bacterium]
MSARKYWLGFNLVKGIGPIRLELLREYFGDLERAWYASEADLHNAGLDQRSLASFLQTRPLIDLDQAQRDVDASGATILTLDDHDYPALLRELPHAPPVLYVKGTLLDADQWAVAFVGTRIPTHYGRSVTAQLVDSLVQAGITIVSGMARGIDAAAHTAALEAGGRTIAVLGCGIDVIYPPEHRKLAADITQHGALVTPFSPGTRPEGKNFPARNQVISGLSLGVVVVEAPESSGALITAGAAGEHGRDVFAVPGNITAKNSVGTNRLIQTGAKLVLTADDILDELNLTRNTVAIRTEMRAVVPSTPAEEALLRYLSDEPVHIDDLCQRSGLPVADVSGTLTLMEMKGMVQRVENMQYVLSRGGGEHYRLD